MESEIKLVIRKKAELDISDIYGWYEKQQTGLGNSFLEELKHSLSLILMNPKSYSQIYKSVRRAVLKKFPYGVFYLFNNNKVIIIACFHFKRNPANWKDRI